MTVTTEAPAPVQIGDPCACRAGVYERVWLVTTASGRRETLWCPACERLGQQALRPQMRKRRPPNAPPDPDRYLRRSAQLRGISLEAYKAQIDAGNRWCSGCLRWESRELFVPSNREPSGYGSLCRESHYAQMRQRRAAQRPSDRRRAG